MSDSIFELSVTERVKQVFHLALKEQGLVVRHCPGGGFLGLDIRADNDLSEELRVIVHFETIANSEHNVCRGYIDWSSRFDVMEQSDTSLDANVKIKFMEAHQCWLLAQVERSLVASGATYLSKSPYSVMLLYDCGRTELDMQDCILQAGLFKDCPDWKRNLLRQDEMFPVCEYRVGKQRMFCSVGSYYSPDGLKRSRYMSLAFSGVKSKQKQFDLVSRLDAHLGRFDVYRLFPEALSSCRRGYGWYVDDRWDARCHGRAE